MLKELFDKQKALDYILSIAYKRGITQKKLSEGIIDHTHFNRMINGSRPITYEVIFACVLKLNMPIQNLIEHSTPRKNINYYKHLNQIKFLLLVQDFDNLQRLYEALLKIENPSNRYLQLITWI